MTPIKVEMTCIVRGDVSQDDLLQELARQINCGSDVASVHNLRVVSGAGVIRDLISPADPQTLVDKLVRYFLTISTPVAEIESMAGSHWESLAESLGLPVPSGLARLAVVHRIDAEMLHRQQAAIGDRMFAQRGVV